MAHRRLVEHRFAEGSLSLSLLAAEEPEPILTPDTDPDRIPFWSVLWSSGAALARRLGELEDWRGAPVLELGCGAGLVGLAAAALGARVVQTDLFAEAVALARLNAGRNGLHSVHHVAADWRHWPFRAAWPVVLASDVAYERACHRPLLDTLRQSLSLGGTAYLVDPGRPMSLDFFALAEREAWRVEMGPLDDGGFLFSLRFR